jgi:hypothetical protein
MPNRSLEIFTGEAEFSVKHNLIDAEEKGEIGLNYSLKYIVKEFHGHFSSDIDEVDKFVKKNHCGS